MAYVLTNTHYANYVTGNATNATLGYVTGNNALHVTTNYKTVRPTSSAITSDTVSPLCVYGTTTTPIDLTWNDIEWTNEPVVYPTVKYQRVTGTEYTPVVNGAYDSIVYEGTGALNVTGDVYVTGNISNLKWFSGEYSIEVPKDLQFKSKLKSNLAICIKSRVDSPNIETPAERVAMETLREVITESEFRKYLRYGFVLVKGKSGATYQVFRNRSHTKVWLNGELVEEICVRIPDAKIPPTDKIIAFRQIIQTSEEEFKKMGNVYKMKKVA